MEACFNFLIMKKCSYVKFKAKFFGSYSQGSWNSLAWWTVNS